MKKFIDFIKKVGSDLYEWFIASNRWLHIICGGVIMVVMMAAIAIWTPYDPIALQCVFGATLATFITMCAVEAKDKSNGLVFDWKDINAGMLVPIVIDIAVVLMVVFG